jgi:hypothetical protein
MKKTSISKIKQTTGYTDSTIRRKELLKYLMEHKLDTPESRKGFFMSTVHGLEPLLRKEIGIEINENREHYEKIWKLLVFPAYSKFKPDSNTLGDKVLSYCTFNNHQTILNQLINFSLINNFFSWFYGEKFEHEDLEEIYLKFNECKHGRKIPDSSKKLKEIQENMDVFFNNLITVCRASLVYGRTILKFNSQPANDEDKEIIDKQKIKLQLLEEEISTVQERLIRKREFFEHYYYMKSLFGDQYGE